MGARLFNIELYVGRFLTAGVCFEIRLFCKMEEARKNVVGETFYQQVVVVHGFVEILARHIDAVLRSFDLCLEVLEGLGSFNIGI